MLRMTAFERFSAACLAPLLRAQSDPSRVPRGAGQTEGGAVISAGLKPPPFPQTLAPSPQPLSLPFPGLENFIVNHHQHRTH